MIASKDFHGKNLERALKDYVRSMPELIMAYGGEPIRHFNIYAEPIGDGVYNRAGEPSVTFCEKGGVVKRATDFL